MFVVTCNVPPSLPMLSIQESKQPMLNIQESKQVANTLMILQCAQHVNCKFAMFFFVAIAHCTTIKRQSRFGSRQLTFISSLNPSHSNQWARVGYYLNGLTMVTTFSILLNDLMIEMQCTLVGDLTTKRARLLWHLYSL
jgi:hypothetical protein